MYGSGNKEITFSYKKQKVYHRNDVVVIKYFSPLFKKEMISVLRVLGVPGDTIRIDNGSVWVNGKAYDFMETATLPYKVYFKSNSDSINIVRQEQLSEAYIPGTFMLNRAKLKTVLSKGNIDSTVRFYFSDTVKQSAVVYSDLYKWNMDNFGPIRIKTQNESLESEERTFYYNAKTDGKELNKNYYFLIGDNFYRSLDSRFIGLIPDSNIEGKVTGEVAD